ncbi:MAG: protein kinase [Thermoanaerobaculia bacterium]|nr:protein kinase [Thermoanaerobaculia bacterium]
MDSHQTETVDPDEQILDLAVLAPGTLVASRYEIERLLGSGGFARVYAARDVELDQRIAIKILRADRMTPATLARLRREVSIAREIPRETLVRVYDLGQDGEHDFLTMELVEGETLRDRIRHKLLDVDEVAQVAEPVLDALGALHAAGVVHRDLKPANILLTQQGAVKLADFGLARRWDGGGKVTRTEALVGTLEYVAPEQALGRQLDGRADLYAFGVLLFEMLTGKLPLEAATNLGTVMAHIISAAPDVRTLRPDVPAWLAELIQQLMEKEPAARPQTASRVLETIRARKRDLGWRWRRSRARLAVYGLVVAVVAAGGVWSWQRYWSGFDHIEADAGRALRAIDRRGNVLWENRALVPGCSAAVVKIDGRNPSVVGVPEAANRLLPVDEGHRLRVYDASTGKVESEMRITDATARFPLDPTFSTAAIAAVDPDHDGREDVLLTYAHSPYWGSYSVYVDPRDTQSSPIFIASGHHRFVGMADIDGDGVDELFFAGMNNRMGWFAGIGAVKLVRDAAPILAGSPWIEAGTPDAEYARSSQKSLLWYALLPRMNEYACQLVSVDVARRTLRFEFRGGEIAELDFDGFAVGAPVLSRADRRAERVAAYGRLRDALRASTSGAYENALRYVREAHSKADALGEPSLGEWAGINEAVILARSGRAVEAEALFDELAKSSGAPSEICWQAGQVFEATGELERAARYLQRGLASSTAGTYRGRSPSGLLESLVLVLSQQEKWPEAREAVERYAATFPEEVRSAIPYHAYLAWRSGRAIGEVHAPKHGEQEVFGYWSFEARWAKSVADPMDFLEEMRTFRAIRNDPAYLYDSLESAVLARLGRAAEAKALAKKALDDTTEAARTQMIARAHMKVVKARTAAMLAR